MKTLGICRSTLINYRKAGIIDALPPPKRNGHWRYDVDGFIARSLKSITGSKCDRKLRPDFCTAADQNGMEDNSRTA